jgi:hypothetical protein
MTDLVGATRVAMRMHNKTVEYLNTLFIGQLVESK